jgi:hypothetical protein
MRLLPQVRRQLLAGAFDAPGGGLGIAGASWPRRLTLAASLAVSLGIAVALAFSLHGSGASPVRSAGSGSSPPSLSPQQAWDNAVVRASEDTLKRDKACGANPRSAAHFVDTLPPRSITSVLSSLARPPAGARRVTVQELRARDPLLPANDVYIRYAWQGEAHGIHYYVVPAGLVGQSRPQPERCDRENLAEFRTEAQTFPSDQRRAAIAYAQARFREQQAAAGVLLLTGDNRAGGLLVEPVPSLERLASDPSAISGSGGNDRSTQTTMLVPDDVASVTATYPAARHPGKVKRTFSVTEHPYRNVVIFNLVGAWDPPRLTFRSATGQVLYQTGNR